MLSNVLQVLLFSSVFQFTAASVPAPNSRVAARRVGLVASNRDGWIVPRGNWGAPDSASASASASASVSASVDAQVMLQSWSTLTAAADNCREVFQQGASLEVALQAAVKFSSQVTDVYRQAGRCTCDPSASDVSAQYQASIVQLLSSLQVVLQIGPAQYGPAWSSRFIPVFQSATPIFESMKQICAQLNINLAVTLQNAHLDLGLFLGVGLNINALLGINLRIGGLLSL